MGFSRRQKPCVGFKALLRPGRLQGAASCPSPPTALSDPVPFIFSFIVPHSSSPLGLCMCCPGSEGSPLHQVSVGPVLPQGAATSHRTRSKPMPYNAIAAQISPSLTPMTGIPPSTWIFPTTLRSPCGKMPCFLAHLSTSQVSNNSEQKSMMIAGVM